MPEGPSIILVKEDINSFAGKTVLTAHGSAKIDFSLLTGKKIITIKTWGKHLLICFKGLTLKIHFLMFGTYLVNKRKTTPLKLSLTFKNGELNFYTCSVQYIEDDLNEHYDWSADVMNDKWSSAKARTKLKENGSELICDALLDQDIFSGVGNIIKNEVLYRVRVHPESVVKNIPVTKLKKIIEESRIYSFEFLKWKRKNELSKHWLAYDQKKCSRCGVPMIKKITGSRKRQSFICTNCEVLYK